MEKHWDVLAIGSSAVDDLLVVDHFPRPDQKLQMKSKTRVAGGQAATAIVAAARQGAKTGFCGRLGEDEFSQFTLAELQKEGVDCSPVMVIPGSKPFQAIIICDAEAGSRTILYSSEGVAELDVNLIQPEWIPKSRVILVDQNLPATTLWTVQQANLCQVPVVADIEMTRSPLLPEILAGIDHLVVGMDFAAWYTQKTEVEAVMAGLVFPRQSALILTAGDQGCYVLEKGHEIVHLPAYPVKVVDTTGCGDVFHGSYAAALARGEAVLDAAQIANITAGLKARKAGGRAGIPSLAEARKLLLESK